MRRKKYKLATSDASSKSEAGLHVHAQVLLPRGGKLTEAIGDHIFDGWQQDYNGPDKEAGCRKVRSVRPSNKVPETS